MNGKKITFDSLAETVGFQLRRASHAMQQSYEAAFQPLDLRISDATTLIGIGETPGCTQADLARSLHIKPANLVPIVSGLVSKRLVTRIAGDGRSVSLHLTDEGFACLSDVHNAIRLEERRIMERVSGMDMEMLLIALKAIARKSC